MKSDEQLLLLDLGDDVTGSAYCTNAEGTLVVTVVMYSKTPNTMSA